MIRRVRSGFVAVALGTLAAVECPSRSEAQAVAYQPTIGTIPDGVSLDAVPVVSADRRYVRLSLNPNFTTVDGIQNFPIPFAVGGQGGGGRGGAGGGGGAGALFGVPMGMNGPAGAGASGGMASGSAMMGQTQAQAWAGSSAFDGSYPTDDWSWSPSPRRARSTRSKPPVRARKPAPVATAPSKPSK